MKDVNLYIFCTSFSIESILIRNHKNEGSK